MESPDTTYQLAKGKQCDLRFWRKKLFTSEDPQFLHKTLGALVLMSFVHRYYLLLFHGSLGLQDDLQSWITISLHLLLSTSSLIFHVLAKRIINRPMIIWEEYRLHAIVFTVRSCSVFAYGAIRWRLPIAGTLFEPTLLFVLVMAHHVVADIITARFGSDKYTTVRIQDNNSLASTLVLRFYAFYQFAAIASHLTPLDLPNFGFNTLVAIQSSAFLMTLYRKSLVAYYTHAVIYASCLFFSLFAMSKEFSLLLWGVTAITFALRMQFRISKYLLWGGFTAAITVAMATGHV